MIKKIILLLLMALVPLHLAYAKKSYNYSETAIKKRIIRECHRQKVDPLLILSLVKHESNFNRKARSRCGAIGLFQLMPSTARFLKVNPYYINQNIKGGIRYYKDLKQQFGTNKLALAAYNAGPGAVRKYRGVPPYRETKNYVKNIMNYYNYLKKNPDPLVKKLDKKVFFIIRAENISYC